MKRILIWLMFVSVCVSCRTTKKTITDVEQKLNIDNKESHIKNDSVSELSTLFSWSDYHVGEKTNAHIVIYDTSKEADKETGKPPVLAEMDIEKHKKERLETKDSSRTEFIEVVTEADSLSNEIEIESNVSVETEKQYFKLSTVTVVFSILVFFFAVFSICRHIRDNID